MRRTELSVIPAEHPITHTHNCISMGSCFAVMIGQKLTDYKFSCRSNPLGILYNPISLHRAIDSALFANGPDPSRITSLHERYVHHDFHSEIRGNSADELTATIENKLTQLAETLKSADWLILTYGTAMMHLLDGIPVASCHKRSASAFSQTMASSEELREAARLSLRELKRQNPGIRVILTVSPVRHVKDTLPVNALSKSKLRMLCEDLTTGLEFVDYFPSYEIMIDDLRDYRYYTRDLIHPSEEAEDYIWHLFSRCYFRDSTRQLNETWGKIRKNLKHRPFNPESTDHKEFLRQTLTQLQQVADKIPVAEEIKQVKSLLSDA